MQYIQSFKENYFGYAALNVGDQFLFCALVFILCPGRNREAGPITSSVR
jgi:hypothetical protein